MRHGPAVLLSLQTRVMVRVRVIQTAATCLADRARLVRAQASIFGYFSQVLDAQIGVAKSRGDYDDGIVRLKAESVELQGPRELLHEEAGSGDIPRPPASYCLLGSASTAPQGGELRAFHLEEQPVLIYGEASSDDTCACVVQLHV